MLTSQPKLMATLFGVVVLAVTVAGIAADRSLRTDQLAQVETSLHERARLVLDQIGTTALVPGNRTSLDRIADRTGAAGRMRVTLIAEGGEVLGDSGVPFDRLAHIENHGGRPEVRSALNGTLGTATRQSETIGHELLYLALPASDRGVVRVAVTLSELEAARATLRRRLALAGGAGLLIAAGNTGHGDFRVATDAIVLGLVAALTIGMLAGFLPARRAAHQEPVDALR